MSWKRFAEVLHTHWSWLKWCVAIGLLSILFVQYRSQFVELAKHDIRWPFLGLALVVAGASIVLTFLRWYLLVWGQRFAFQVKDALRFGFIGYLFNYVMPGATGGDIVKALLIAREQSSRRAVAAATVLLDRILGMLALFMVGAFAALFQWHLLEHRQVQVLVSVLFIGTAAGLAGLVVLMTPRFTESRPLKWMQGLPGVGNTLHDIMQGVTLYQKSPMVIVGAILISIVGHFGMLSSFYLCSLAIQSGATVPGYWGHLMLIPGAELAAVAIPLPGGVGALEGAVMYVYGLSAQVTAVGADLKAAEAAGLFTAIAYRAVTVVVAAIGAGYYLTARREISEVLDEGPNENGMTPAPDSGVEIRATMGADQVSC